MLLSFGFVFTNLSSYLAVYTESENIVKITLVFLACESWFATSHNHILWLFPSCPDLVMKALSMHLSNPMSFFKDLSHLISMFIVVYTYYQKRCISLITVPKIVEW